MDLLRAWHEARRRLDGMHAGSPIRPKHEHKSQSQPQDVCLKAQKRALGCALKMSSR